jgi:hypothetical protein
LQRELQAEVFGIRAQPAGSNRIAPESEEAVVHPDPLDAKHTMDTRHT